MIEPRLAYTYAILDANNCCVGCRTYNVEVPLANYVPVPRVREDYIGKYYSYETGLFYYDVECTQIFNPEA
jgi:hypothetical protein